MNEFMISSTYFAADFLIEQDEIHAKNLVKQQEAIDLWHKAGDYPRKMKKRLRKKANKDYNFWVTIDKWHQDLMKF